MDTFEKLTKVFDDQPGGYHLLRHKVAQAIFETYTASNASQETLRGMSFDRLIELTDIVREKDPGSRVPECLDMILAEADAATWIVLSHLAEDCQ